MAILDPTWTSRAPKVRHVRPFDGLRGIGVLGVLFGHALPHDTLSFSGLVDWFLVLSGFLITTLLLQEHRENGRVDLRKFYARRSLRLLPSLYVVLAGTVVVGVAMKGLGLTDPIHTLSELAKEVVAAFFYVHNVVFPTQNGVWMGQLWTLSLEEQFYLVVGLVMLVALRKGYIKPLAWVLALGIVTMMLIRGAMVPGLVSPAVVALCSQRPDSLMMGALVAIISAHVADPIKPSTERTLTVIGTIAFVVSVLTLFVSTSWAGRWFGIHVPYFPPDINGKFSVAQYADHAYWVRWGHSLVSFTMGAAVFCFFRLPRFPASRPLSAKFLVWVGGGLSYALYISHSTIQYALEGSLGGHIPGFLMVVLKVVVPFVVAWPLVVFVESRAMKIKNRFSVTSSRDTLPQGS